MSTIPQNILMPDPANVSNSDPMYFDELKRTMEWLATIDNSIFIGQAVEVPGTGMFDTLKDIPSSKKIEFPVSEDFQLGFSIGLALNGFLPITVFPRWDFLLLATNQLVNHLDKIKSISSEQFNPKVIIRTAVGSQRPLNPQHQHAGDYTSAFSSILQNIDVFVLNEPSSVFEAYEQAILSTRSSLIVEYGDFYNEK